MKISVGNSRTSRAWKIKEFSWEKFVQKCSQTIRTAETVQEYRKLPKGQQDNIKDVGGFDYAMQISNTSPWICSKSTFSKIPMP